MFYYGEFGGACLVPYFIPVESIAGIFLVEHVFSCQKKQHERQVGSELVTWVGGSSLAPIMSESVPRPPRQHQMSRDDANPAENRVMQGRVRARHKMLSGQLKN